MINDTQLLNYVLQSAEMGCRGITSVRHQAKDPKIDGVLCGQLVKYGKMYHSANSMLKNKGADIEHISPMAKAMTSYTTNRELKRDNSTSHIAEMMIKGSTMGVNKMARHMRDYDGCDPQAVALAKKMLETEEENINELKEYL